jgi:pantoate--beta-alanine ligase
VHRLARDLDIPIEIIACSTVREVNGLAMSSRNVRLSSAERRTAPKLAGILFNTAERLSTGAPAEPALAEARTAIFAAGYEQVEYLELRADGNFAPLTALDRPARLLAAAWLGETRLIDNVNIPQASRSQTWSTIASARKSDFSLLRLADRSQRPMLSAMQRE